MIELTPKQWKGVAADADRPPRVVDPNTHTTYVLVPEQVYDRAKGVFEASEDDDFVRELTPHVMKIFGEAGWGDPAMDVYNDL